MFWNISKLHAFILPHKNHSHIAFVLKYCKYFNAFYFQSLQKKKKSVCFEKFPNAHSVLIEILPS